MKRRLLVVDDDESIRFAMQRYFAAVGYQVDCASEAGEAAALLASGHYDALLADLRLTGSQSLEGLDLIERVRRSPSRTRTILLTAYSSPEIELEAKARGVDAVVKKPRPLADIAQLITSLVEAPAD